MRYFVALLIFVLATGRRIRLDAEPCATAQRKDAILYAVSAHACSELRRGLRIADATAKASASRLDHALVFALASLSASLICRGLISWRCGAMVAVILLAAVVPLMVFVSMQFGNVPSQRVTEMMLNPRHPMAHGGQLVSGPRKSPNPGR